MEDRELTRAQDEQRKKVSQDLEAKLRSAQERFRTAKVERDRLIVEALRSGSSIREVSAAVDLSHTQVRRIGEAGGWPTEEELERRRLEREANKQLPWHIRNL